MKTIFFLFTFLLSSLFYHNSFSQVSQQWVSIYNGPVNDIDESHSIATDGSGNVYVTGKSKGTGTGYDYATLKYNSSGVQQWAARYNGEGARDDYATAIAVDAQGNVYVTGWSNKSATGKDFLTIKYNSLGDSLWVQRYSGLPTSFNDEATSIAVDNSGNVYVTGYSVNGTNSDYATIKYNSSGVQQWVSRYNGPGNGSDNALALVIDGNSNVYVTGNSFGNVTGLDYATIKYNSSGDSLWVQRYSGLPINLSEGVSDIAVDLSGNVYVTGGSPGNGTSYDYATIKYNSSGIQQWASRYEGPSQDVANSLAVDGSGNVYVTGQSLGSGTMDDYATLKYNSSGVEQWVRRYDGPTGDVSDIAHSLTLDNSGNIYVTGESNQNNFQFYQFTTIKYNSLGDSVWVKSYDGNSNGHDRAYAITVDASANVYVTGVSGTNSDYATIKYSQATPIATISGFIEGFYNSSKDKMISDTAKIYLRNINSPYALVDSSKSKLDSSGTGTFSFSNATNGVSYYIVLKHRNSIETWSSGGNSFTGNTLAYNFSSSVTKAYGSNEIQVDASPIRFAIYSGDVDQNGFADLTDINIIFNDASNFVSGYVRSDVNGDSVSDLTDLIITFNNSSNFVAIKRP